MSEWTFSFGGVPIGKFSLANDPPKPSRGKFDGKEHERQRTLFAGMDCLPGQIDLFDTDSTRSDDDGQD